MAKKSRRRRILLGFLITTLVILVGGLITAWFVGRSMLDEEFLKAQIRAASDGLEGSLQAASVEWAPFPFRLVARDLELSYADRTVGTAREVRVLLNPMKLATGYSFRDHIAISGLVIRDLSVDARWDTEHDTTDFLLALEPLPAEEETEAGTPLRLTLEDFDIEGLTAHWDITESEYAEVQDLDGTIGTIDYTPTRWNGTQVDTVTLAGINLHDNRTRLTVDGTVESHDDPVIDLDIHVETVPAVVRNLVPEDVEAQIGTGGSLIADSHVGGTSSKPDVEVHATGRDLAFSQEKLSELEATVNYVPERVTIRESRVVYAQGEATATGAFELNDPQPYRLEVTARAAPARKLARPWVDDTSYIPERISGTARLSAPSTDTVPDTIIADVTARGLSPEAWPAGTPDPLHAKATVHLSENDIRFEALHATGDGLTADVTGLVGFDDATTLDLEVQLDHQNPTPMLRAMGQEDLRVGRLRANVGVNGSLKSLHVTGHASASSAIYSVVPPADFDTDLTLDHTRLTLSNGTLTFAQGSVAVDGSMVILNENLEALDAPELDLQLRGRDLDAWTWSQEVVKGVLDVDAHVTGTTTALAGNGTAKARDLVVGTSPLGTATGSFRFVPERNALHIIALQIEPEGEGTLNATGEVLIDTSDYDFTVTGRGFRVERLLQLAELDFSFSEPAMVSRLRADLKGTPEKVGFDVTVVGDLGDVRAEGTLEMETDVVSTQVSANLVGAEIARALGNPGMLEGTIVGQIAAEGTLPYPDLSGAVRLTQAAVYGHPLGAGSTTLTLRTDSELDAWFAEGNLFGWGDGRAVIWRGESLIAEADLGFKDLPIHEFLPEHGDASLILTSSGHATVRYEQQTGIAIARARIEDLVAGLEAEQDRIRLTEPFAMTWDGSELFVSDFRLQGPRGMLTAGGTVGEALDVHASGAVRLEIVPYFAPDVLSSTGMVSLDVRATGTPDVPSLTGNLTLTDRADVRVREIRRPIEIQDARIVLRGDTLELAQLSGGIGQGRFEGGGSLSWTGTEVTSYDLRLQADDIPVETREMALTVDGTGRIAPGVRGPRVSGRIDLIEGRYRRKFELRDFNFVAKEPAAPPEPPSEAMAAVELDLAVVATEPVNVQVDAGAFALELELLADMKVGGNAGAPRLDGRVNAQRGSIEFPRATLDVSQAVVDFAPVQINQAAEVELRAEGDVVPVATGELSSQPYLVTVSLDGNLNEMSLDLNSDPQLTPVEILSLLVTGYANPADITVAEERGSGREALDAALAFTGAQLAAPVTQLVTRQLEQLINLRVNLGAEVTTEGVRVTARQSITERLYIEGAYQAGLGEGAASVATGSARFYFSDRFFIEGLTRSTSTEEQEESDVKQRVEIRYRILGDE